MALPRKDAKGEREKEGRFRSNNESFQSDEIEFEIAAKVELSRKKRFSFQSEQEEADRIT